MSIWLSSDEMKEVVAADLAGFPSPVPTQVVSNGEYNPLPQTPEQKQVEAQIGELAESYGKKVGLDRREFLRTASGMAAAFFAMNQVHGALFNVGDDELKDLDAASERAASLSKQFIFDDQVHFVRDDYKFEGILDLGRYASKHWNPAMLGELGIDLRRYKFDNFVKEIFLDSDTKIALLSGAPFDDPDKWFLSNDQLAKTREIINRVAGTKRLFCHALFTPGTKGWLDDVDHAIELKPDSWKGYTVGDPLGPSEFPWRLDDEKLLYPFYEKIRKAGIKTICIHKGLLPRDYEKSFKGVWKYAMCDDIPKAAKDWPDINFVIYHAALRPILERGDVEAAEFEKTGYIRWVSDLAEIPKKHGVTNVYGEIGTTFGSVGITNPKLAAGLLGTLIEGMGVDHVIWGTDSVWYGSPQWQIEAMRRIEIPEDLQKRFGYKPLGAADGPVKSAIFGENAAKLYGVTKRDYDPLKSDVLDRIKKEYRTAANTGPSNAAYGYICKR